MPVRFALTPDELNAYHADAWAQPHLQQLADDWAKQYEPPTPSDSLTNPLGTISPPTLAGSQPEQQSAGAPAESTPPTPPPLSVAPSPPEPPSPADLPAPDAPVTAPLVAPTQPVSTQRPLAAPPATPAPTVTPSTPARPDLVSYARQAAQKVGIDPDLFVRQINQESGFNPSAASPAGARGIAQIVPKFHPGVNPDNPTEALDYAAGLMKDLIGKYGDVRTALVAYNGGQGAVNALNAGTPYAESVKYVQNILNGAAPTAQSATTTTTTQDPQTILGKIAPFIGKPYVWGGKSPDQGFDCSGLAGYLTTGQPESTVTLYGKSAAISQDQAQPGDLVFWNMGSSDPHMQHVGVYLGNGRVVQSGGTQAKVNIGDVNQAIGSAPEFRRLGPGGAPVQAAAPSGAPPPDAPPEAASQQAASAPQSPDETVTNPFGEAMRQLGAVKDQVVGNIGTNLGLIPRTSEQQAKDTAFQQQSDQLGVKMPSNPIEALGGSGLGAPTEGDVLSEQRNQAIAQNNPLRDVPVAGGATTMAAQAATDPTNLLLFGPGIGKAAVKGAEVAGPAIREFAASEEGGLRLPGGGNLPSSIPGETTPPSITGPKLAKMVGTPAEQAALRPEEEGRAANILLDKFPEDVRPHLQDVADRFAQFAGQRRGVITDDQAAKNAADVALGTTTEKWIKTPAGKAFNQEQAIALGNTLSQVGQEYDGLLSEVSGLRAAGKLTPEKEAELADKTLEFAALAGVRSGAAAEAGRALRAFRAPLKGGAYADRNKAIDAAFKAIGADKAKFTQWVEEFSKLPADDPIAKYKMLQGLQQPSWWNRISILRYASMLSAMSTHLVNAFGNTINTGLDVALKPIAVGIDVARAGATGGERTRYMGEIGPQIHGMLEGAASGFFDGLTALKTGINPQDLGKFENVRAGFQSGSPTVDTLVEAPLRLLTFSDNVFRSMAKGGQVRAIAARNGIKQGLSGAELRTYIDNVVQNLPLHPDVAEEADSLARRAVLQEPNALASAVTSIGRGPGSVNTAKRIVREIVIPFSKTPLNILGQGLEMTPAGLLKVGDLAAAKETGAATDAAARVAFGSALMVGVGALAANGLVTGGYPADAKDRDTLPPGWQPWSVRIPKGDGGHTYVSFSQLGPVAIPMAIAAIAGQSVHEGVVADPATLAGSLGKFMLDQTFLQGLSAIMDAIKDPKRYGENVSEQLATSFVPYAALSRQMTRALDQADRDPKGAIQAIQALIPGVAENVPRRQDALGRDIHSAQTGIGAFISPARYNTDQPEPILKAFRDVGSGLPSAPSEIRIRSAVTNSLSPPIALNENEKNDYQRIFGERLQQRLASVVNTPAWQQRTAESRKRFLDQQVQLARDYAESQVYAKMAPADRQQRMQQGRAKLQVKPLPAP